MLGVDMGGVRTGFAVCDEQELLAVPSGCARTPDAAAALAVVAQKADEEHASRIVVGHPLNMNGRPGPKAREAEALCAGLTAQGRDAVLWDERLTTAEAGRLLKGAGLDRRRRMDVIDANSAQRILESYLGSRRREGAAAQ